MFIRPKKPTPLAHVRYSMEDLGYKIDSADGRVRSIATNETFDYDAIGDKKQAHDMYQKLAVAASRAMLDYLADELQMEAIAVPSSNEPHCHVYATHQALHKEKLVVIVVGNGNLAGIWGWNVLVKQGANEGTAIQYIKDCQAQGAGVLVLNPNMNIVAPDGVAETYNSFIGPSTPIRGSETAEEHVGYIWSQLLRDAPVKSIAFITYNTAGIAIVDVLKYDYRRFVEKTACVAFIDSTHTLYELGEGALAWLKRGAQQWETTADADAMDVSTDRVGCSAVLVENTTEFREMTPALCKDSVVEYVLAYLDRGPIPNAAEFGPGWMAADSLPSDKSDEKSDNLTEPDNIEVIQTTQQVQDDGYIGWE
ncbi:hypothetical protein LPJ79_001236 [Coemansia sp. RSA 1821]|nr:hypothetical protein LPJ68_001653 [Coemansia sp. RSA 1086]KAJ1752489.1 hypothetical protein LPJ79_001236 [Coemansia sp. RSA 1821]KAJ2673333.1 hypothetical protein IWW42_002343 [Coemansia sp. RSA 1085]